MASLVKERSIFESTVAMMFSILKFENQTLKPRFLIIFPAFIDASFASVSHEAPRQTIFPFWNMRIVVLGFLIFINAAGNLLGL